MNSLNRTLSEPDVAIAELLAAGAQLSVCVENMSSDGGNIRGMLLVDNIEQISDAGPDKILILTEHASKDDWMVSAAIRYAWERRSAGVVVKDDLLSNTARKLAQRLNINLLSTAESSNAVALELAVHIGLSQAGSIARLQRFASNVADSPDVPTLLSLVSKELDGNRVAIELAGSIVYSIGGGQPEQESPIEDSTSKRKPRLMHSSKRARTKQTASERPPTDWCEVVTTFGPLVESNNLLRVTVPTKISHYAKDVLAAAAPTARALIAEFQLKSLQASLPQIAVASVAGSQTFDLIDGVVSAWPSDTQLVLPTGPFLAIFILADRGSSVLVHQSWFAAFQYVPLSAIDSGWFALLPLAKIRETEDTIRSINAVFENLIHYNISVGTSNPHIGVDKVQAAVQEAWLAARLSSARAAHSLDFPEYNIMVFSEIPFKLIDCLLPTPLANQLALNTFPKLLDDSDYANITDAVIAWCSCHGSAVAAAAQLDIHRNTLHSRLRRARELGVPIDNSEMTLPTHLILTALRRARRKNTT